MASVLFAVALLFSGQNATLTGTLAGQIIMEGFLSIRLRPWLRRLITRLVAIVPAVLVILVYGERGTGPLLILSQVTQPATAVRRLSALVHQRRRRMGELMPPVDVGVEGRCGPQRLAARARVQGTLID
jgi:manganese transport protein